MFKIVKAHRVKYVVKAVINVLNEFREYFLHVGNVRQANDNLFQEL